MKISKQKLINLLHSILSRIRIIKIKILGTDILIASYHAHNNNKQKLKRLKQLFTYLKISAGKSLVIPYGDFNYNLSRHVEFSDSEIISKGNKMRNYVNDLLILINRANFPLDIIIIEKFINEIKKIGVEDYLRLDHFPFSTKIVFKRKFCLKEKQKDIKIKNKFKLHEKLKNISKFLLIF